MVVPITRRKKLIIKTMAALLALYLAGSVLAGIFLAEISIHLPRRQVRGRAETEQMIAELFHAQLVDVSTSGDDGIRLKGWYVRPALFNGSTVILLHGITDNRTGVVGYARMFLAHGYAVLLPDARAHGESEGTIATYGIRERNDIRHWVQWVDSKRSCVYLFGESLGAAIALQATAVTPGVCAVAVESPYSQFREIAYDRVARHAHVGMWFSRSIARPMLEISLAYARVRYNLDLTEASPENALKKSNVPALLIHGTADINIPIRHSQELMRTCGTHASLWTVQGADHGGAVGVAPEEFEARVIGWFQSHRSVIAAPS